MEKLPPVTSLVTLDAFYQTGSIAGAAALLGRTHSAVSKQLHQLQDYAGVELFVKRGLYIELTRDGRIFAQQIARNLDDMRKAYNALRGVSDHAEVTVAVGSTFARYWLIPMIARFNTDFPEIDILVRVAGPIGTRSQDGPVDLVISWDRLLDLGPRHPEAVSLGDVYIGPVLSPNYPYHLTDAKLTVGTLIHRRYSEAAWGNWTQKTGISVSREHEVTFDLLSLVLEAAERGMGVAIAPKLFAEAELKRGTLIAPVGFLQFKGGLYLRPSNEKQRMGKSAKIFFDWLVENAQLGDDGFIKPTDLRVSSVATKSTY